MNWDTDHGQVVPGYLLKGWEMGDGCHWPRRLETGNWEINHGNGGRQFLFNRSPVRGMGDWRLWTWSRHLEDGIGNWDTNHGSRKFLLACFKGWKTGVLGCDLVVSRMGWGIGIQSYRHGSR